MTSDFVGVLNECRPLLLQNLLEQLTRLRNIKWHIACRVKFVKYSLNAETGVKVEISTDGVFHGHCQVTLLPDIYDPLRDQLNRLMTKSYKVSHGRRTKEVYGQWTLQWLELFCQRRLTTQLFRNSLKQKQYSML